MCVYIYIYIYIYRSIYWNLENINYWSAPKSTIAKLQLPSICTEYTNLCILYTNLCILYTNCSTLKICKARSVFLCMGTKTSMHTPHKQQIYVMGSSTTTKTRTENNKSNNHLKNNLQDMPGIKRGASFSQLEVDDLLEIVVKVLPILERNGTM